MTIGTDHKEFIDALNADKFSCTCKQNDCWIFEKQVRPNRRIDVQIWADGKHRASNSLNGVMNTTPTDFSTINEMYYAIHHESHRTDHPTPIGLNPGDESNGYPLHPAKFKTNTWYWVESSSGFLPLLFNAESKWRLTEGTYMPHNAFLEMMKDYQIIEAVQPPRRERNESN